MARKLECCELRTIYVEEYYFKKEKLMLEELR